MKIYLLTLFVFLMSVIWLIKEAVHINIITKKIKSCLKENYNDLWERVNHGNIILLAKWITEGEKVDDEELGKLREYYKKRCIYFIMALTSMFTGLIYLLIIAYS